MAGITHAFAVPGGWVIVSSEAGTLVSSGSSLYCVTHGPRRLSLLGLSVRASVNLSNRNT